jgi:hypothetical protein
VGSHGGTLRPRCALAAAPLHLCAHLFIHGFDWHIADSLVAVHVFSLSVDLLGPAAVREDVRNVVADRLLAEAQLAAMAALSRA